MWKESRSVRSGMVLPVLVGLGIDIAWILITQEVLFIEIVDVVLFQNPYQTETVFWKTYD